MKAVLFAVAITCTILLICAAPAEAYTVRHFSKDECNAIAGALFIAAKERDQGVALEQQYKDIDQMLISKDTIIEDQNDAELLKELIRVAYSRPADSPIVVWKAVKASCYEKNDISPIEFSI
jgi:hypothetical protein